VIYKPFLSIHPNKSHVIKKLEILFAYTRKIMYDDVLFEVFDHADQPRQINCLSFSQMRQMEDWVKHHIEVF